MEKPKVLTSTTLYNKPTKSLVFWASFKSKWVDFFQKNTLQKSQIKNCSLDRTQT